VPDEKKKQPSAGRLLAELPLLIAVAVVIAYVLKAFLAQAFYIPSPSMSPQLEVGDRVVVSKVAYRLHEPRRGDIVVFDSPEKSPDDAALPVRVVRDLLEAVGLRQPSEDELIKRVIGLPGETVEGREGRILINGYVLVEPYLPAGTVTSDFGPIVIPDDFIWVMGDNRANSQDSRFFGPVDRDEVVGRAIARVWPPPRHAFL
jgi:signal peptidase I